MNEREQGRFLRGLRFKLKNQQQKKLCSYRLHSPAAGYIIIIIIVVVVVIIITRDRWRRRRRLIYYYYYTPTGLAFKVGAFIADDPNDNCHISDTPRRRQLSRRWPAAAWRVVRSYGSRLLGAIAFRRFCPLKIKNIIAAFRCWV